MERSAESIRDSARPVIPQRRERRPKARSVHGVTFSSRMGPLDCGVCLSIYIYIHIFSQPRGKYSVHWGSLSPLPGSPSTWADGHLDRTSRGAHTDMPAARGSPSFFSSCFLTLPLFVCSETLSLYIYFLLFFALSSDSIPLKKVMPFFSAVFRVTTTYINILGVAKDTC